jgi:heme exporter protein B
MRRSTSEVEPRWQGSALLRQLLAVVEKELRSEFRQRVSVAVTVLSVGVIVLVLAFALGGTPLSGEPFAARLWVVFFLGLSPAVGRSFLAEEERGTRLLLHMLTSPAALYWGKLTTNVLVGMVTNVLGYGLFLLFLPVPSPPELWAIGVLIAVAAFGFAATLTLLSAAIAGAHHRGVLLPILGLPVVVPLVLPGIEATRRVVEHAPWATIMPLVNLMVGYGGAVAIVGFWLFEWVWRE